MKVFVVVRPFVIRVVSLFGFLFFLFAVDRTRKKVNKPAIPNMISKKIK